MPPASNKLIQLKYNIKCFIFNLLPNLNFSLLYHFFNGSSVILASEMVRCFCLGVPQETVPTESGKRKRTLNAKNFTYPFFPTNPRFT